MATSPRQDAIGKALRLLASKHTTTDQGEADQLAELVELVDPSPAGDQPAE